MIRGWKGGKGNEVELRKVCFVIQVARCGTDD